MPTPTTFGGLVNALLGLVNMIIPIIFAGVFIFLVWKIFDAWVINADDERKLEEGKQYAVVSVIVIVVMIITWGIVQLIRRSIFTI